MTPDMVLAILKKIASSTYRGRRGLALIDEVCRPYNLSDADFSRVMNRLVEQGYVISRQVGIVAVTAEGINRASQFFYWSR
jgi:DNA-binding transcriptional MocR family regulator